MTSEQKKAKQADPENVRRKVAKLIENFEAELRSGELRLKVLALIPIFHGLRDLGKALIPSEYKSAARARILYYFRKYPFTIITSDELLVVSGIQEYARRVRELRTEFGWPITTKTTGRPDLAVGVYVLQANRQSPEHDRHIPDDICRAVLRRDGYRCSTCGWSHDEWNPSDPRHLELHHIRHHAKGGANVEGNLKTLCTICHDKVHRREKKRM